jgi:polyhydroxyalkanoate synthesis regulator phasin
MKVKTILELVTLSSSLYYLTKDKELMEHIQELSAKGKDKINSLVSEPQLDEDGNEMELVDKIIHKANQAKSELEEKIEESVSKFYKKIHVAHLDEVHALNERLEQSNRAIALLEARLNHLEMKK